jgi:chemotaxis signal transduction protein
VRGIRGAASEMGNKESGSYGDGASPGGSAVLADNASGPRAAELNQPATPDVTSGALALVCAGFTCAVPLTAVREVVAGIPAAAPLPDSPAWLLGVMQWRGELIALIDPLPILTGNAAAHGGPWRRVPRADHGGPAAWRPIIGLARGADPSGLSESGAAIVLGDDTCCIALAVDTVDTLGSLVSSAAGPAARQEKAVPVLPRYTAGMTAKVGGSSSPVLRTGTLLEDVVAALTEEGGSADD